MPRRVRQDKMIRTLLWALGLLVVATIVVLVLMLAGGGEAAVESQQAQEEQLMDKEYVQGVSVAGVDVSGLTLEQAQQSEALAAAAAALADTVSYTFTVEGTEYSLSSAEMGIHTDVQQVLKDALSYGNIGDGAAVREEANAAREGGKNFDLTVQADETVIFETLKGMKSEMDILPMDATLDIADDVMGEARFTYTEEVKGVDVDAALLAQMIAENINTGVFTPVEAPTIITNPSMDMKTLQANTKRIGEGFTSVFDERPLNAEGRVANIKILADIVNGTEIKPGEVWSINEAAGPRNRDTAKTVGWQEAPGISKGRYEDQVGGGVCQVSSTVYNAAIRAELTIVERQAHSWPSSYIKKGMDATISTGGPDLKLSNPFDMPIYLAAFVDEEAFTVTVEVYGPPLTHGFTVEFTNELVGTVKAGESEIYYDQLIDPEGDPIDEGKKIEWVKPRDGQKWRVWKQYLGPNGEVIDSEKFGEDTSYAAFTGEYYVNGPDPDALPVAPTEAPGETPTEAPAE